MHRRISRKRHLAALAGLVVAAGTPSTVRAETYTLRMAISTAPDSIFALSGIQYAKTIGRRSNGQMTIEVYPSGQLSKEDAAIVGLQTGVLDLTMQAAAFLVSLVPQYQVLALPFLMKDLAAGYRVLDGPVGNELFGALEPKGIIGLTWVTSNFKQIQTTTKPVVNVADMKGMRIRIVGGQISVATYQAMGALPVLIDVTETYTALTQRTVDGLELSLDSFVAGKFHNVEKHVAMTNHFFTITPLLGSKKKIESLPAPFQKMIKEEGRNLLKYVRSLAAQREAEAIQTAKAAGVTFTEIQYPDFRKAMDPVYNIAAGNVGREYVDRVNRAAASARG